MAVVSPLKGWHYATDKIKNLSEVIVPPYDVISPSELKNLRNKNQWNFSNLIMPEGEDKYSLAAETFRGWQNQKVLTQDKEPTLYFYKQIFKLKPLELFCQNVPAAVKEGGSVGPGLLERDGRAKGVNHGRQGATPDTLRQARRPHDCCAM